MTTLLKSMTGFGRSETLINDKKFTVDIRCLNSKSLDLNIRIPHFLKEKEFAIRSAIAEKLVRGKIDVYINYDQIQTQQIQKINAPLLESYIQLFSNLVKKNELDNVDVLAAALKMPDVMKSEETELDEEASEQIINLVNTAIASTINYRSTEGEGLFFDLQARNHKIQELRLALEGPLNSRDKRVKDRLKSNLDECVPKEKWDENRFEQELIYYMEKMDISEEFQRLLANTSMFHEELTNEGQGKKLGFISQEIGREINTIGSKANDAEIQRIVVMMKDELEKIKEQLNNVL
jgi:uncharacterized protein (TIGR00255 family)